MKKILYTIGVACMMGALTGCSKFLEAENRAALEADNYYETPATQAELRVSMYNGMKSMATVIDLQEWGTDLYATTRGGQPPVYQNFILTAEDGGVNSFYQNAYSMIKGANAVLKYASSNPQYVAEAKFIRCLGYYLLTQQFGAVPYVTEYIETANKNYPRSSLANIYESMIAELESIKDLAQLPEEDHNGNISRRAVKALLAKICLAAGWDLETTLTDAAQGTYQITGTALFGKAAQYASEAINGQSLTMSFEDKWSPFNEGNAEEIFSVQYQRAGYPGDEITGGHSLQNTYGSQYGSPMDNCLKSCSSTLVPSAKSLYLWGQGDQRYDGTFMTTIYNGMGVWGTTGYYAYYNATAAAKQTMRIMGRYFPWYTTTAEAEAFIAAHQEQLKKGDSKAQVYVVIMANPATAYMFDDNGNIASTTIHNKEYYDYLRGEGMTAVTHCVKKFDDAATPQANNATGYRDIVMLHLSDLYLVAAEASLMAGNETQALKYINDVRTRAGAPTLPTFAAYAPDYALPVGFSIRPIDLVLDERARELYAERTRWMDLRRTRQLVRYNVAFNRYVTSVADMCNNRGEVKWYRPIPAAEIETNTAISNENQNPGY
jgi:hypothetical protein